MIKKLALLLVSGSTLLVGMQMNNAEVDAVTSVAHGGGAHASVHAATPHATPSVHTTPSISRSTVTHSSPSKVLAVQLVIRVAGLLCIALQT